MSGKKQQTMEKKANKPGINTPDDHSTKAVNENQESSEIQLPSKESSKRFHGSVSSEIEESGPSEKKAKKRGNKNEKKGNGKVKQGKRCKKHSGKKHSVKKSDNQTEEPEKIGPTFISINWILAALNKFTSVIMDIVAMIKMTHKDLLDFTNKKINLQNINSLESVIDIQNHLISLLVKLELNVRTVREGLEKYQEEWCQIVKEDIRDEAEGGEEEGDAEKEAEVLEASEKSGEKINTQSDEQNDRIQIQQANEYGIMANSMEGTSTAAIQVKSAGEGEEISLDVKGNQEPEE